jgi:hypothetical protein
MPGTHAMSVSSKIREQLDIGIICKSRLYNLRKLLSGIVPWPEKCGTNSFVIILSTPKVLKLQKEKFHV